MFQLGFLESSSPNCYSCGLDEYATKSKFPGCGKGKSEIMLVYDQPSGMEDVTGKPLIGQQYTFIDDILNKRGLTIKEDCWKITGIGCALTKKYTDAKIKKFAEHCHNHPRSFIKKKKPKLIICFGGVAASVILRDRFSDSSAGRWRGLPFWSPEFECYVVITYDPNKLEGSKDADSYGIVIERDVNLALKFLNKKPPKERKPEIETSYKYKEIIHRLRRIHDSAEYLAVDFETTGLKPDNPGHRIASCSYTYNEAGSKKLHTFSFIVDYNNYFNGEELERIHFWMRRIAENSEIKKIAHHLKFEENWTKKILRVTSDGWIWCTMYTAHIIDERQKFVGLKFQSFLHFQAPPYEEKTAKYLRADEEGGNNFNHVDKIPIHDLLYYNGLDTYYTFLLYLVQRKHILKNPTLYPINDMFLNGALCFADMEEVGFGVIPGYFDNVKVEITGEIEAIEKKIQKTKACKKFTRKYGRPFEFNNDKDVYSMIYDVLETEISKKTKGGKGSTDAEVLMGIAKGGCKWASLYLEHTKLSTAKNTFVNGILKEITVNNTIHTFYHLFTTRTGRSSSTSPNWQNLPKRDEKIKKLIRSGIRSPFPNHIFCEADYGSLEVRIAGCYTLDPVLLKYINNPATDMHRDTAGILFFLDEHMITKMIRFYAKNGYVFANFYGASPKSCARNLWKIIPELSLPDGEPLENHLAKEGIKKFEVFQDHIIDVSKKFWKKFKVFKKWQEDTIQFYNENGYIENKFGFRRRGFLSRNEIINTNIQGSAFQCLLWSATQINRKLREEGAKSKAMGQIHDSLISSVDPSEQKYVYPIIKYVMEEKLRKTFPWVVTPMEVEFEATEPGGTWYDLKAIDIEMPRNFVKF